jgi:hypothetical protein
MSGSPPDAERLAGRLLGFSGEPGMLPAALPGESPVPDDRGDWLPPPSRDACCDRRPPCEPPLRPLPPLSSALSDGLRCSCTQLKGPPWLLFSLPVCGVAPCGAACHALLMLTDQNPKLAAFHEVAA